MTILRLHASCAARGEAGVLLLGAPGAGKSSLLLRLLTRGYDLVADDRVELRDGLASAPLALRGLIEVRGWGIVQRSFRQSARPVLAVQLVAEGEKVPRLPTDTESYNRKTGLPVLWLNGTLASAPDSIDMALECLAGRACLLSRDAMPGGDN
ncbi:HPr kinase/phosphorylase [Acetobacter oeni]|uniref:HPr kinase/phosphorylase C-terminal domain-containing protein n=1 Tax=Acetobacter oeni TaxID=304077 RepID=A0A511XLC6_9PROT|nr:serine kinase [Acetobacter oeni]MBB3883542.1 HPr kinase/phosphorylase [Acetobacter oeni]NHO19581.1 serine kinase [Acetobacter oeni]GBR03074.1 HPr kinase [Acetobacter oeni LMG 21952]GEN63763.1 hypothetical protein AOE01nite_19870 [Acetobacter oeni]